MRKLTVATILTLIVVLSVLAYGNRTEAQSPTLAGTFQVSPQEGGQPSMLLMLNADGTAMATDTKGTVRLGAWVAKEDGTLAIDLQTLADIGGAQGTLINGAVAEQADGTLTLGDEYRLKRITP